MIKTFLARYLGLMILAASKDVSIGNRLHYFLHSDTLLAIQEVNSIFNKKSLLGE